MAGADNYPRPDFVRHPLRWQSLNGPWKLLFDDEDVGLSRLWQRDDLPNTTDDNGGNSLRTIEVPFVFQSKASGIGERAVHEVLWYERSISDIRTAEEKHKNDRALLRFGAVDYHATVWIDGYFVGEHRGGHVPFEFDVTDTLTHQSTETHRLTVRVFDSATDLRQPRGKQFWEPESKSIYYTPSSGIWQSVWIEVAPAVMIADSGHGTILRSHDIENGHIDARIAVRGRRARQACSVQLEASIAGMLVHKSEKKSLPKDEDFVRFDHNTRISRQKLQDLSEPARKQLHLDDPSCWRDGVALWSPEHPLLYDLTICLFDSSDNLLDEVQTSTGMRSLNWSTGDGTFRLNGQPYFQSLLLDQGYWPDTIMTPPSQDALKRDIELSKAMGFNGCRKHQKVEDPVFMYWANKLGFLVWGEMASCYAFSLDYVDRFDQEWMEMLRRDINHPCIVAWTPANESWGYPDLQNNVQQRDHIRSLYYRTKTLDPTRPINDNCGWEHVLTDFSTFHDYADGPGMAERCKSIRSILRADKPMFLPDIYGRDGAHDPCSRHERGAPILCTEFGGVNISSSRDPAEKTNWGYTTAKDADDLLERVERIVMATVEAGHICGIVWTQFTDIEQEQNGLYTYDRKEKLPADRVKDILRRACGKYHANRR